MDLQDIHDWLLGSLDELSSLFQKVPGSAIFLRYVKSSYQDDPVRSAIELFLCLFAVRYLLAPSYSTQKKSYVRLSEEVSLTPDPRLPGVANDQQEIDELVDEWTPEPLVAPQSTFEEAENEKRPVIVGYGKRVFWFYKRKRLTGTQAYWPKVQAYERANGDEPSILQLSQLHRERNVERKGYTDTTQVWSRPLWPSRLLRYSGCTYQDRGRYRCAHWHAGMYRLCSGILHHLQCYSSFLEEGGHNRCRQVRELCHPQRDTDIAQHGQVV